jgi:hypothetical protein
MNVKELNKRKIPVVVIDNSLEKYVRMPIFQDKVDEANEMLRTIGLPKEMNSSRRAKKQIRK